MSFTRRGRFIASALALGLLLQVALLILWRLAHVPLSHLATIVGWALMVAALYRILRGLVGPAAANRPLRSARISLAVPGLVLGGALLLAGWRSASAYAPWAGLLFVLLVLGVSRPHRKKLSQRLMEGGSDPER